MLARKKRRGGGGRWGQGLFKATNKLICEAPVQARCILGAQDGKPDGLFVERASGVKEVDVLVEGFWRPARVTDGFDFVFIRTSRWEL